MKINKIVLAILTVLAVILIPVSLTAKDSSSDTIILTSKNLLILNSQVDGDSVGPIALKAKELDAALGRNKAPLYLYLNTPGGSVQDGLELIESLKGLGRPVHTITAFAASMGFQIAENLDNRYMLKSGILMSHRATGQFDGAFGGQYPSQLDSRLHIWVERTNELDQNVVDRSGGKLTLESYRKAYDDELWMSAKEAVAGGYADAIIKVKCDKSISGVTTHQADLFGMTILYDLDNCPINSSPLNIRISASNQVYSSEYIKHVKNEFLSKFENKNNKALPLSM